MISSCPPGWAVTCSSRTPAVHAVSIARCSEPRNAVRAACPFGLEFKKKRPRRATVRSSRQRAAGLSAPVPGHGGHSYIHEDGAVRARSQIGRALAALPES